MNTDRTSALAAALLIVATGSAGSGWAETRANPQIAQLAPVAAAPADAAAQEARAREYFTDLELVTQDGDSVRFFSDVLKDRVVLISFVYTNCEDACPLITHKVSQVRDILEGQIGDKIRFVTISLDPVRDSPAALKRFAREHHADHDGWVFLTGQQENVNHIIKKLGAYTDNIEAHSTLMLAGNVRTARWTKIPPMVPPQGVAEMLSLLAENH